MGPVLLSLVHSDARIAWSNHRSSPMPNPQHSPAPALPSFGRSLTALSRAAENGQLFMIQALLARGDDASEDSSRALFLASRAGHAECVRALIPSSDALASRGRALRVSAIHGRFDCAQLLLPAMGISEEAMAIFEQARLAAHSSGHALLAQMIRSFEERESLISVLASSDDSPRLPSPRI